MKYSHTLLHTVPLNATARPNPNLAHPLAAPQIKTKLEQHSGKSNTMGGKPSAAGT